MQTPKEKAWHRIGNEVRRGRIKPARTLLCIDCGKQAAHYDHYLGYIEEHHFTVEPVCNFCHKKRAWNRGECPRHIQRKTGYIGPLMKDRSFVSRKSWH